MNQLIVNDLAVKNVLDPEVEKDREVGDDPKAVNDLAVGDDPKAVNDREVEMFQEVEIDHAVVDDPEDDRIRETVPFQESVYLYQEYDDRNGDRDRERGDDLMIGPEIDHVTDQTDHVIDENQLIESAVDHVTERLIENAHGEYILFYGYPHISLWTPYNLFRLQIKIEIEEGLEEKV